MAEEWSGLLAQDQRTIFWVADFLSMVKWRLHSGATLTPSMKQLVFALQTSKLSVSKSFIFRLKSLLRHFSRHLAIFSGHTGQTLPVAVNKNIYLAHDMLAR